MKTVLFYVTNGIGLGHLQRTRLIAEDLRRENIKIVLVTNAVSPEVFGIFFDHLIKLTPLSDKLLIEGAVRKERLANGRKFVQALQEFRPDALVADFSFRSEFHFYPFRYAKEKRHLNIRKIFIWRLGDKKTLRQCLEGGRDALMYFQKIILPHTQEELEDLLSPESLKQIKNDSKFQICPPIFKILDKSKLIICQKKYEISPEDFLLLVTFGGGGASEISKATSPDKLLQDIISVYPQLIQAIPNLKIIIITGPYFKNSINSFLLLEIPKAIKLVEFEEYLPELMHLSCLIFSSAGYNTCNELIGAETPAILAPLSRGGREQFWRAEGMEKKGIVKIWQGGSAQQFLDLIIDCQKNLDVMKLNFKKFSKIDSGQRLAAKIILDFLNEEFIKHQ